MNALDVKQTFQRIGEIRWGTSTVGKNGGKRPERTATFRLTPNAENCAIAIAKKWGGEVLPWEKKFEVTTDIASLPVMLPPEGEIFRQWYELWQRGRRTRWCDSQNLRFGRGPCMCPHAENPDDPDEVEAAMWDRVALAKQGKACKLRTDMWFLLPTVPGLGLWRASTHSRKAASRLQHTMAVMDGYRSQGIFLTATFKLTLEQSESDGQTNWHPVPFLDLDDTLEALANGTAGSTTLVGAINSRTSPAAVGAAPARLALAAPDPLKDPKLTAADFARLGAAATTAGEIMEIWAAVKVARKDGHDVFPPVAAAAEGGPGSEQQDGITEAEVAIPLKDYLHSRWEELGGKGTQAPAGAARKPAPRQNGDPDGE